MNDRHLFGSMAAASGKSGMAAQDERRPGEDQGAIAEDREQARKGGGGSIEGGYAGTISTCPIWCGAAIDGVVNYCCPSCREICEGFAE
jgi:hypothetical protein